MSDGFAPTPVRSSGRSSKHVRRNLADLSEPCPFPSVEAISNESVTSVSGQPAEVLKAAAAELNDLQRYQKLRAIALHKHLIDVANALNLTLQLEPGYNDWMDVLRNTEIPSNEELTNGGDASSQLVLDANAKRKREERRRREKEKKRKKKKRSGSATPGGPGDDTKDAVTKPPDSIWMSTEEYFRFPVADDLQLIDPKVDESLFEIPPLGRHFPDVWKEEDDLRMALKKKRKSYQSLSRRFRPKSDPMAILDTNLRKNAVELEKLLKLPKGFQQHSLAQRCLAAIVPLRFAPTPRISSPSVDLTAQSAHHVPRVSSVTGTVPSGPAAPFSSAPTSSTVPVTRVGPGLPQSANMAKISFEERVRLELKYMGLVPANKAKCVDLAKPENRSDDELSTHLRSLQAQLKEVNTANVSRCENILPKATSMLGCYKQLERIREAEKVLEKLYTNRNSNSWNADAAVLAITSYNVAVQDYKNRSVFGNTGTYYLPSPQDFAGTPRAYKPTPKHLQTDYT